MSGRMPSVLLVAVLLAGAPGMAGCIGDTGTQTEPSNTSEPTRPHRVPPSAWRQNLSEEIYEDVTSRVVDLTASDGTHLSLSVHVPAGLPSNATVPTLLTITPYQSFPFPHTDDSPATQTGTPSAPYTDFVRRGAALVVADARGTGGSGGCLDFGGPLDRADARTFVAWIRNQSWSNGRIVTDGVSHPGMGSLVAHVGTDVNGSLAHAPVVSYYRDEWYQGAKFEDQLNGPLYTAVESSPSAYDRPEAIGSQVSDCPHQTMVDFGRVQGPFTETWAKRDLARYTDDNATEPLLLTHGFLDTAVHPDHSQHYWEQLPEDTPAWLIMGWWYHGWPDMEGYPGPGFDELRHRWLDRLLFETSNGAFQQPAVLVEDNTGTWHESPRWPLAPSENVTLNASADGSLVRSAPQEGSLTYTDDPRAERGEWGDAKVLFETQPLDRTHLVNGAPTVHLSASSSADATKWVVYLVEVTDEGQMQRITHGYADSHTYGKEGTWQDMEPGTRYKWTVDLMSTAVVVEQDHKVGLLIASQDSRNVDQEELNPMAGSQGQPCWQYEQKSCYAPSGIVPAETTGRAENTVYTGPDGTSVELSWVDPNATAKPPWTAT